MKKSSKKKNARHTKAGTKRPRSAGPHEDGSQREAILDERHDLQKLFPNAYSPQISIFTPERVEVMLTLSRSQAENLATLLKQSKL
jgi:hypothetical protein